MPAGASYTLQPQGWLSTYHNNTTIKEPLLKTYVNRYKISLPSK